MKETLREIKSPTAWACRLTTCKRFRPFFSNNRNATAKISFQQLSFPPSAWPLCFDFVCMVSVDRGLWSVGASEEEKPVVFASLWDSELSVSEVQSLSRQFPKVLLCELKAFFDPNQGYFYQACCIEWLEVSKRRKNSKFGIWMSILEIMVALFETHPPDERAFLIWMKAVLFLFHTKRSLQRINL